MSEQVDGALEMDGSQYLVEIKWQGEPVEINAMSRHLVRVYGRSEVRELFISASGFTGPAIKESERGLNQRVIVLGELRELVLLLEQEGDVANWLLRRSASLSSTGAPSPYWAPTSECPSPKPRLHVRVRPGLAYR
ncbi:hypothetical protein [Streptomyces melanogenes]|uniref:hypothetical protein n=1 Tax=Streptomyces melanogenes TaxID=67326 RepID=UPI0037B91ADA